MKWLKKHYQKKRDLKKLQAECNHDYQLLNTSPGNVVPGYGPRLYQSKCRKCGHVKNG